jgi:hypothetical protein
MMLVNNVDELKTGGGGFGGGGSVGGFGGFGGGGSVGGFGGGATSFQEAKESKLAPSTSSKIFSFTKLEKTRTARAGQTLFLDSISFKEFEKAKKMKKYALETLRSDQNEEVREMYLLSLVMQNEMANKTMSANKQYQPKMKGELIQAIQEYQQGKHKERGEPNDWDVSLITDMSHLFFLNDTFNEPLNKWVTKQVTNMSEMFYCASKFNQPLNGGYKPHCWAFIFTQYGVANDSTKITGRRLFHKLPVFLVRIVALYAFGDHIGGFDTSQVTNMSGMFNGASSFNQPIGQWKTNQVTGMRGMFCNASSFNQPIGQWKTNQVTDMSDMFLGASSMTHPKPTTN